MRTAIDTNVISALWSGEPASQGMAALLGSAKNRGGLVICAPVYVELLAYAKATRTLLEQFLTAEHGGLKRALVQPLALSNEVFTALKLKTMPSQHYSDVLE